MQPEQRKTIVVTGATGMQGSAVTRCLLKNGWRVAALTRRPDGQKARELAALGAHVVQGDMEDKASLLPVFQGAQGVYSVQNPVTSGVDGEIRQGKNVGEAAREVGVNHLVYASAGTGARGTGIPSWESKLVIEDYYHSLGLPLTILRPMAFMELMTEKKFYPAMSTWSVMPLLMGDARPVVWLCAADLGVIVERVFGDPQAYTGKALHLASDIQSIDDCRLIYREVFGKNPPRLPMPSWLFERFGFVGQDLGRMWRWLRTETFEMDTTTALSIHPQALTVRQWLQSLAASS